MKKSIKRTFAAIFAIAMVCAAVFALVACNGLGDDDANYLSLDGEISAEMRALADKAEHFIERGIAYIIAKNVEDETKCYQFIAYSFQDGKYDSSYGELVQVCLLGDDGECEVMYFENEEQAQLFYENENENGEELVLDGDIVITNKTKYEEILNNDAKLEATKNISKRQVEYAKNHMFVPVTTTMFWKANIITFGGDYNENYICSDSFWGYDDEDEFLLEEGLYDIEDIDTFEEDQKFLSINYTADSYIKIYDNEGLVEVRLKEKPGWHISESYEYEGEYELDYYWDGTPIKEMTVPAQIAGLNITMASIDPVELDLDVLTVEEGLEYVHFNGCAKTVNLPKSMGHITTDFRRSVKGSFSMGYNPKLETINFGGTESELTFDMYYNPFSQYDYKTDEKVGITFTVNFSDGTSKVYD